MAEKKKAKVYAFRSSTTSKSAKEAAYGKTTEVYKKPTKPVKDVNSADYMGMTAKQKNTKYYERSDEAASGEMAQTLKRTNRAKIKDLTNKEVKTGGERFQGETKGKNFSKVTVTNVDKEAYNRVMKRAQESGLSAKDAKKAIDAAIRTTSAGLKSDRDKVAMRFKMQDSKKKIAAQNKIKRGY
jgi:hypothetical protein